MVPGWVYSVRLVGSLVATATLAVLGILSFLGCLQSFLYLTTVSASVGTLAATTIFALLLLFLSVALVFASVRTFRVADYLWSDKRQRIVQPAGPMPSAAFMEEDSDYTRRAARAS